MVDLVSNNAQDVASFYMTQRVLRRCIGVVVIRQSEIPLESTGRISKKNMQFFEEEDLDKLCPLSVGGKLILCAKQKDFEGVDEDEEYVVRSRAHKMIAQLKQMVTATKKDVRGDSESGFKLSGMVLFAFCTHSAFTALGQFEV